MFQKKSNNKLQPPIIKGFYSRKTEKGYYEGGFMAVLPVQPKPAKPGFRYIEFIDIEDLN